MSGLGNILYQRQLNDRQSDTPAGYVSVPIKDFQDLLGLIDPPPVKTLSGTVMVLVNPHSAEVLTRISAIVRRMQDAALAHQVAAAEQAQQAEPVAVPDGWDAESVRLAFSTLRYIIGLEPGGVKAPCEHVQDIINRVASWSDMGPCHPVRKQYEAAAAHRAMLAAAPQAAQPLSAAIADIAAERRRQIEAEGWTPEHDDAYREGHLADAAACYALCAHDTGAKRSIPAWWPWRNEWWKPTTARRDLVKAGALIAAEIERIDRAAQKGGAV